MFQQGVPRIQRVGLVLPDLLRAQLVHCGSVKGRGGFGKVHASWRGRAGDLPGCILADKGSSLRRTRKETLQVLLLFCGKAGVRAASGRAKASGRAPGQRDGVVQVGLGGKVAR